MAMHPAEIPLQPDQIVRNASLDTSDDIAHLACDKLYRDGYLAKENGGYIVLMDGMIFAASGGYEGKRRRDATSASLQSVQTWAIALGTVFAGAYSLYELLRRIWPHVFLCG